MVRHKYPSCRFPKVPVNPFFGRDLRQINEQQLQRVHHLAKLPIDQTRPARDLLQVARHLPLGQPRQGFRAHLLQKLFDPAHVPRAHRLGHALAREQIQVTIPVGRGAVLAAPVGWDGCGHGRDWAFRVVGLNSV
jgi:hypothetical protein